MVEIQERNHVDLEHKMVQLLENRKGIYQIRNIIDGKFYIGSSADIVKRWNEHRNRLNKSQHHSQYLQNAWNKYGKENFVFEIVEKAGDKDLLLDREQHYIDTKRPQYNISRIAGSPLGVRRSSQTKEKLSKINKGKKLSEETKKKLSKANKGKILSKSHKKKISDSQVGEKHSQNKLKEKQVKEIRSKYIPTIYTQKMLAEEYGVSRSCIEHIINYKNWGHL